MCYYNINYFLHRIKSNFERLGEAMVIKKIIKTHIPLFFGMIMAFMLLVPVTAWADETAATSEDNPSLFIKEGGLPEAAAGEIKELMERRPEGMAVYGLFRAAGITFEDYLVSQLQQKNEVINVGDYKIKREDIYSAFAEVLNRHPELFYVSTYLTWFYSLDTGYVLELKVEYFDYDEEAINNETEKVLNLIDDSMSDLEKVIFIHDYLCIDVEYAYEDYLNGTVRPDAHSLKGALLDKSAVCDGYASAFQYYMLLLDIPCKTIVNSDHAWNQVYVNGKWYFVDVTWDDPVWDYYGNVSHQYLLKSKNKFTEHDWNTASGYVTGNNTTYDTAFWDNVSTQMIMQNGEWYYVGSDGNLYKHNFTKHSITEAGSIVTSLNARWPVFGSSNSYYGGNYVKIAAKNNVLYYTQPSGIYKCNFDGSEKELDRKADSSKGYVYGMKVTGGNLYFQTATEPYKKEREKFSYSLLFDIRKFEIKLSGTSYAYTGSAKKPKVTINGLVNGTDYTVAYKNNTNVGTASVIVTGRGNYTGTLTKTFSIYRGTQSITVSNSKFTKAYGDADFDLQAKSSLGGKLTYTSANPSVVTVSPAGKVTIKGTGSTTITVSGAETSNYKGAVKTIQVIVNRKNISGSIKIYSGSYVYNGKAKQPKVTLGTLVQNRDFKVSYSDNINIGTAKITVTGIGNYKGTLTRTFKIVPAQPKITVVKSAETGKIQVKWEKQNCGGYEIAFSRNNNFSTVANRVTVTSSSNISKTVSGFTSGKTYYIKIRAYKTVNGQKYYSAYSQKLSVTVK